MRNNHRSLQEKFTAYAAAVDTIAPLQVSGRLTRIVGLKLEAVGLSAPIGAKCMIEAQTGKKFEAEVVGFSEDKLFLMCADNLQGLSPGAIVTPIGKISEVPVGREMLGRVFDGSGTPIDNLGIIHPTAYYSLQGKSINPLNRAAIQHPLDVGIRAINALCTVGRGQRLGLFAGSGVGKSVLLGMMTLYTTADIIIVGLIGERGREIKEFIEHNLGAEGLARSVVIAAPADTSPLMRLHGAMLATTIAEYFRDQGAHVLLLLDSLSRFAQAQRELALSIGEPPTTKGYAPSVFSKLSQLVERAGNAAEGNGSITAFYTVLAEGDDHNDPIADAARAILDGHIVLTRRLADMGHYPAIDIEASISRVMSMVATPQQIKAANKLKQWYSRYQQNQDLIRIGAYQKGSDQELDIAIQKIHEINAFLQQSVKEPTTFAQSLEQLVTLTEK